MSLMNFTKSEEVNSNTLFLGILLVIAIVVAIVVIPLLVQSSLVATNSNTPFYFNNPGDGNFATITLDGRTDGAGGLSAAVYLRGTEVNIAGLSGGNTNGVGLTAACPADDPVAAGWSSAFGGPNYSVGSVAGDDGTTTLYYLPGSEEFLVDFPDGQQVIFSAVTCDQATMRKVLN